jgi:hypothetical protein
VPRNTCRATIIAPWLIACDTTPRVALADALGTPRVATARAGRRPQQGTVTLLDMDDTASMPPPHACGSVSSAS